MLKPARIALALSAALVLAACQQEASAPATTAPQATDAQSSGSATSGNVTAAVTSPLISITPASMAACDPATAGTVKWDVREARPQITGVAIYVGSGAATKLFAEGGPSGEAETGPWVRPGSEFELKDKGTSESLGHVTVGGPTCQ